MKLDTRFHTVAEVAEHLRVSKAAIYREVDAGRIPAVRINRTIRIPAEALAKITALEGEASA